ncbi:hypothetical protein SAMN04488003_10418 [Loktanella fryxellensis]|uniref:Uncharacterized protein n=1 Tax=Loktanella fryxellensis TaxID=245187 RepID=A0A1H8AU90_9RHOB|nr:hypothetical protein [Loktanella fryxellensis]SEM73534.1 hypothetical protein SAMN04488003_10418 [Loktanella fryxellensis]
MRAALRTHREDRVLHLLARRQLQDARVTPGVEAATVDPDIATDIAGDILATAHAPRISDSHQPIATIGLTLSMTPDDLPVVFRSTRVDTDQWDTAPAARAEKALLALTRLPDVQPRLIWVLQQCGIADLSDLAAADLVHLEGRLGLFAVLLPLADWQDVARRCVHLPL